MTNEEAIKSMRNLDDVISITESEHESVKTAISALEHNSLLVEHISNLQNENIDFFNKLVECEKENTKLKADNERLKENFETLSKQYCNVENSSIRYYNEMKQLKAELEQSVKLPCKVGDNLFEANDDINEVIEYTIKNMDEIMIELVPSKEYASWLSKITSKHIGNLVFITREEAEQALKSKGEE